MSVHPEPPSLDINVERHDGHVVVHPVGRLDATNGPALDQALEDVFDGGANRFVLDMSGIAYISSLGLAVLLRGAKRAKGEGGRISLCALQDGVTKVFEISGFFVLFDCFETRAEALAALTSPGQGD